MPAHLLAGVLSALPAIFGDGEPSLAIRYDGVAIAARIEARAPSFVGGVILALTDRQVHYFDGLPPLLADFVVLGVGVGHDGALDLAVSQGQLAPAGIVLHAQAVVADGAAILGSAVVPLVRVVAPAGG